MYYTEIKFDHGNFVASSPSLVGLFDAIIKYCKDMRDWPDKFVIEYEDDD